MWKITNMDGWSTRNLILTKISDARYFNTAESYKLLFLDQNMTWI